MQQIKARNKSKIKSLKTKISTSKLCTFLWSFHCMFPPFCHLIYNNCKIKKKKLILLTWFPHNIFGPWSWQFVFHWLDNCEWWQGASKLWGCKCMRHWGKHWTFNGQGRSTLTTPNPHCLLGGWLTSLSKCSNSQGNFCQIKVVQNTWA
jgi:hypothetical protein